MDKSEIIVLEICKAWSQWQHTMHHLYRSLVQPLFEPMHRRILRPF